MLKTVGVNSLQELINKTIPVAIHIKNPTKLGRPLSETETLKRIAEIAGENKIYRSYIGQGYYGFC
jgi:glycine dehydrogenase